MAVIPPAPTKRRESVALRWLAATALTCVTILCAQVYWNIPQTPIPVTGQVFAVLLSGLLLGSRWGAVAQVQYLALGAGNLHVFAQGNGGMAILTGLTGGYLLSYPLAAFLVGLICEHTSKAGKEGTKGKREEGKREREHPNTPIQGKREEGKREEKHPNTQYLIPNTQYLNTRTPEHLGQPGMAREHRQMLACAAGLGVIYGMGSLWYGVASHTTAVLALLQGALIFLGWDAVKAMAAIGVTNALKLRK